MSRFACIFSLLLLAAPIASARHIHHAADAPSGFQVGGLQFVIPDAWQATPSQGPARIAQWKIPAPHVATSSATATPGDGVEVVVFFFGPGVGGTVQDNLDAWAGTITTPDGKPATAPPQKRTVAGHIITEVLFIGTYAQVNPQPGLPPTLKPGYSLIGAVVENPAGSIYWRVTGPAAQITAIAPAFDQMLASLKPQAGP